MKLKTFLDYSLKKKESLRVLFCILISISCFSCNFFVENGGIGASTNIEESKARAVFIKEYAASKKQYKINDTLSINVKSAWLEHQWRYSGAENEKAEIVNDKYQLIIVSDKESLKGYYSTWFIGSDYTDKDAFYKGYQNNIIINLDTLPKKRTIGWKVQSLQNTNQGPKAEIVLGNLSLNKISK